MLTLSSPWQGDMVSLISGVLAQHHFSIFYISTFESDFVLVKQNQLTEVLKCLNARFNLAGDGSGGGGSGGTDTGESKGGGSGGKAEVKLESPSVRIVSDSTEPGAAGTASGEAAAAAARAADAGDAKSESKGGSMDVFCAMLSAAVLVFRVASGEAEAAVAQAVRARDAGQPSRGPVQGAAAPHLLPARVGPSLLCRYTDCS